MSTSLAETIAERRAKCSALEKALELYPDAYIQGDYLCSDKLKAEDCDYVFSEHTTQGDLIRVGRRVDTKDSGVVVCRPFAGQIALTLLWELSRESPELYQKLVQLVAKR